VKLRRKNLEIVLRGFVDILRRKTRDQPLILSAKNGRSAKPDPVFGLTVRCVAVSLSVAARVEPRSFPQDAAPTELNRTQRLNQACVLARMLGCAASVPFPGDPLSEKHQRTRLGNATHGIGTFTALDGILVVVGSKDRSLLYRREPGDRSEHRVRLQGKSSRRAADRLRRSTSVTRSKAVGDPAAGSASMFSGLIPKPAVTWAERFAVSRQHLAETEDEIVGRLACTLTANWFALWAVGSRACRGRQRSRNGLSVPRSATGGSVATIGGHQREARIRLGSTGPYGGCRMP
jgi:hypothetical protein